MNINIKPLLLTVAMVASGLAFTTAQAATVTAPMDVKIEILDACEINMAPTELDFGQHGVLSSVVNATSDMQVTCTTGAAYSIALSGGGSGDINARVMTLGTDEVEYQLYQEAGRTTVWGETIPTDTVASVGTGTEQDFTVYGQVPVQATPPAGIYTDTVTVTVDY
ncbi:MAG TPA: spore coat U domain-containing protein [Thiopseudomonas sp.]|nr:spore coat U domain-containing protein [Thiopseudomonas sp.]